MAGDGQFPLPAGEIWTSVWGPEEEKRIGAVAASLLEKVKLCGLAAAGSADQDAMHRLSADRNKKNALDEGLKCEFAQDMGVLHLVLSAHPFFILLIISLPPRLQISL